MFGTDSMRGVLVTVIISTVDHVVNKEDHFLQSHAVVEEADHPTLTHVNKDKSRKPAEMFLETGKKSLYSPKKIN